MQGEEVFLRGLFELIFEENQQNIANYVFGNYQAIQTLSFKFFISHIFDSFNHLVTNNLEWWRKNDFWNKAFNSL